MTVTIRDVAKRAGVGIATVSRVLNASPSVSEETREKVLQAIEELNFTPNPIARRLSTGRTLTIGVIVPYFTLPDFVKRLQGVQSALIESDYDLVLFNVETPAQRNKYFQDLNKQTRVDGLLIMSLGVTEQDLQMFATANTPVVLIDSFHPHAHRVIVDHIAGGRLATNYLLELGHKNIGFVSDNLENPFNFTATIERHQGYRSALEEAGLSYNPAYFQHGEHGREVARHLGENLLNLDDPPTAVFAATDTQAIGVLDAARKAGKMIPDSFSIIGYNDIRDAEYLNLTTVRQPLFESGVKGVEMLLELIETPMDEPQEILLDLELVTRGTTAPPG
ncbi:MAG: LacI family DNA-binding transcriptional regulator [Anaerolineales bacterium]|jgi:DNA-binding LacI/PurR family transcriptional regulator